MIISRTPFRVSLFGGGTDYPDWIRDHGGAVLGMAINKYCYLSVRSLPPFFAHKHRIVYSRIELANEIDEIEHPAVRAIFSEMGIQEGLEVHHDADLPARSGLGSSSSFSVGLLNSLYALRGQRIRKAELGAEAIRIEQEVIGEAVGCQDQVWAAFGGLNRIEFHREGGFSVHPLFIGRDRRQELAQSLLLVFSGLSRYATEVAKEKIGNIGRNERHLHELRRMVDHAQTLLVDEREPIYRIGEMLNEAWMVKRGLASGVTNQLVDDIYQTAMAAGASGGKLLGAGGGGFLIFVTRPEKRAAVCEALRKLIQVAIDIDNEGSRIMIYEPNGIGSHPSVDRPLMPFSA
ncbi:MAG: kinase [Alphaproteobacteria bacterium]|nr:kinase [Alphaproteobacteria bacterium]MBV9862095.1 kinase [Alphaproteobacteria bacterium]